jgi:hypothetical protein
LAGELTLVVIVLEWPFVGLGCFRVLSGMQPG